MDALSKKIFYLFGLSVSTVVSVLLLFVTTLLARNSLLLLHSTSYSQLKIYVAIALFNALPLIIITTTTLMWLSHYHQNQLMALKLALMPLFVFIMLLMLIFWT